MKLLFAWSSVLTSIVVLVTTILAGNMADTKVGWVKDLGPGFRIGASGLTIGLAIFTGKL